MVWFHFGLLLHFRRVFRLHHLGLFPWSSPAFTYRFRLRALTYRSCIHFGRLGFKLSQISVACFFFWMAVLLWSGFITFLRLRVLFRVLALGFITSGCIHLPFSAFIGCFLGRLHTTYRFHFLGRLDRLPHPASSL